MQTREQNKEAKLMAFDHFLMDLFDDYAYSVETEVDEDDLDGFMSDDALFEAKPMENLKKAMKHIHNELNVLDYFATDFKGDREDQMCFAERYGKVAAIEHLLEALMKEVDE